MACPITAMPTTHNSFSPSPHRTHRSLPASPLA
uniref:Uncharacterized protein n=1 Tax=Anguilla anguilla TaxID=7936 RepID=A0A0E9XAN7_ANGAN